MIWLISAITVLYVISISARGHGAAGDLPTAYPGPVKQPSLPIAEGASDTPSPPITALPTGHPVTSNPTITPQSIPIARTPYTNTTAAPGFKPAPSGPASGDIVHFSGGNPSGPKPAPGVAPVTWLGAPNSSSRPPGSRLPVTQSAFSQGTAPTPLVYDPITKAYTRAPYTSGAIGYGQATGVSQGFRAPTGLSPGNNPTSYISGSSSKPVFDNPVQIP